MMVVTGAGAMTGAEWETPMVGPGGGAVWALMRPGAKAAAICGLQGCAARIAEALVDAGIRLPVGY